MQETLPTGQQPAQQQGVPPLPTHLTVSVGPAEEATDEGPFPAEAAQQQVRTGHVQRFGPVGASIGSLASAILVSKGINPQVSFHVLPALQ